MIMVLSLFVSAIAISQTNNSSTNNGNTTQRWGGNTAPGFRIPKETPRNATNTNTAQQGTSGQGGGSSAQPLNGGPGTLTPRAGSATGGSINNRGNNAGSRSAGRATQSSGNANNGSGVSTTQRPTAGGSGSGSTNEKASPFVGGIYPADNAKQHFDSVSPVNPNTISNRNTTNATIAGGNDTTFNVNTINQGGVTTNSGATDRSGQAQFGQTNWGESRRTIGASQWTVPPPITASFSRDFPQVSNATWSRNNVDTSLYSARYQSGAQWVTRNYSASGSLVDVRTEVPVLQAPRPVSVYLAKQPQGFQLTSINRLEITGRPVIYQLNAAGGKTVYINEEGMEVRY